MWVGGKLVGMEPDRPSCGPGPCGEGATPCQPKQVYGGFDITGLVQTQLGVGVGVAVAVWGLDGVVVTASTDQSLDIFVSGFGIDQTKQQESAGAEGDAGHSTRFRVE